MPNIELHGFFNPEKGGNTEANLRSDLDTIGADLMGAIGTIETTFKRVQELLAGVAHRDEVVVTVSFSSCEDLQEKHSPFLRIWATKQEEVDDIVHLLQELDIDIEVAPLLRAFIPKKSTQQQAQEALKTLHPTSGTDQDFDYAAGDSRDKVPPQPRDPSTIRMTDKG